MTDSFKVAVIQHAPVFLNIEHSLLKARDLVEEAASNGAQVIAFPETWLPGYPVWLDVSPKAALWDYPPAKALYRLLVENAISIPGRHLEMLRSIAQKTGTYVIMGAHEYLGGTLYNTMLFLHRDGQTFQLHRKLVPTYTERLIWGRGDGSTLRVFNTEYGNIGGLICWEHWMPLARAAMHARFETLHVAQVLSRRDVIEGFHSLDLSNNRALEILEEIPGQDDDLIQSGGSAIIGPDAGYLAGPVFKEPSILYAELEPRRITEGHLVIDTSGHYARPDVFHLEVNVRPRSNVTFRSQE
jgi:predicted amidohydrolase